VVYVHKVGARDDKTVKKCAQSMVASTRSLPQRYKGEQYENIYCWNSSGEKPRKRSKIVVPKSEITKPRLNRVESRDEGCNTIHDDCRTTKNNLAINWKAYFDGIIIQSDTVIVSQPLTQPQSNIYQNDGCLKEYLKWNLLNGSTSLLSTAIETASLILW
jgi:hypothetical protein